MFALSKASSRVGDAKILEMAASVYEYSKDGYVEMFLDDLNWRIRCGAALKRIRRAYRREKTEQERLLALYMLHGRGINEVSLRLRIVRFANLW